MDPWLPKSTLCSPDVMRVDTFSEGMKENNELLNQVLLGFNTVQHEMAQITTKMDFLCTKVNTVEEALARLTAELPHGSAADLTPVVVANSSITPIQNWSSGTISHLGEVFHNCPWLES